MQGQLDEPNRNYAWVIGGIVALAVMMLTLMFIAGGNVRVYTENTPAVYREGRLYFTANGENVDITDKISNTKAFTYTYEDDRAITHYLLVGGSRERYGYAEFMREDSGCWIGEYRYGNAIGKQGSPIWLKNGKKELGIPWV